jgi:hypothetical protein
MQMSVLLKNMFPVGFVLDIVFGLVIAKVAPVYRIV